MDEHTEAFVCVEESFNGNLRIRLSRYKTCDGDTRYMVEVAAWNAWAAQAKLLSVVGGIELDPAEEFFADLTRSLRGYDWVTGECILADGL